MIFDDILESVVYGIVDLMAVWLVSAWAVVLILAGVFVGHRITRARRFGNMMDIPKDTPKNSGKVTVHHNTDEPKKGKKTKPNAKYRV